MSAITPTNEQSVNRKRTHAEISKKAKVRFNETVLVYTIPTKEESQLERVNQLKELLKENKNIREYTYQLGVAEFYLKRYKDSIIHLSKAIQCGEDSYFCWYYKGAAHLEDGQYAMAVKCLGYAIKHNSDHYKVFKVKGEAHYMLEQDEEAIACLRESLERCYQPDVERAINSLLESRR